MPELPDVELFKRYLDSTSLDQNIREISTTDSQVYKTSPASLKKTLEGHSFDHSRRVGKYLFVKVKSDGYLIMHFGMTGYLKYYRNEEEKPDYIQLLITFTNDFHLAFISKRKLGKLDLTEDVEKFCRENDIGPDAMELDKDEFRELLSGKKGKVKTAMMDQSLMSGLGNVYVDEILFHSHIHPETPVGDMDEDIIDEIYSKMHQVVDTAIGNEVDPGEMPDSYLLPRRKEGEKCPNCGGEVKKITVNGRGTYFCPDCQRK